MPSSRASTGASESNFLILKNALSYSGPQSRSTELIVIVLQAPPARPYFCTLYKPVRTTGSVVIFFRDKKIISRGVIIFIVRKGVLSRSSVLQARCFFWRNVWCRGSSGTPSQVDRPLKGREEFSHQTSSSVGHLDDYIHLEQSEFFTLTWP